jgi:zinc/manganese transport system permease protein
MPWTWIAHMLGHPFIQHAFLAGTAVAIVSGLIGYFLVLRAQVFTADALSHVAFTGALAALAAGLDARLGLYVLTIAVALAMGLLGPRGRADDVVIGGVFAWILGLGVLFLTLYTTRRSGTNGTAGVNVLFGSIFGLDAGRAWLTVVIAAGVVLAVLLGWRPLLFITVDDAVAAARGLPVRAIGLGFLALTGATAAEATQVVGALLLLGLLAAPAGAALQLTTTPARGAFTAAAIAVVSVWAGLTLAYGVPRVPPSFGIIAVATALYVAAIIWGHRPGRRGAPVVAVAAAEPQLVAE